MQFGFNINFWYAFRLWFKCVSCGTILNSSLNWYLIRKPHETSIPIIQTACKWCDAQWPKKGGHLKFLSRLHQVSQTPVCWKKGGCFPGSHGIDRSRSGSSYSYSYSSEERLWLVGKLASKFGHGFSQSFAREPEPKAAKKDTGATPRRHWTMTGTVFVLWQEALRLKRWLPQRFLFHPFPSCSPYIYPLLISWWRLGWEMCFVHVFCVYFVAVVDLYVYHCKSVYIYLILHILIIFMDNLDILNPFLYMCIFTHFIVFLF